MSKSKIFRLGNGGHRPPLQLWVALMMLVGAVAWGGNQATVVVNLRQLTGTVNNRAVSFRLPSGSAIVSGTNFYVGSFTVQPTNGAASVKLGPGNYYMHIDQWPQDFFLPVPDSTNSYSAADLARQGAAFLMAVPYTYDLAGTILGVVAPPIASAVAGLASTGFVNSAVAPLASTGAVATAIGLAPYGRTNAGNTFYSSNTFLGPVYSDQLFWLSNSLTLYARSNTFTNFRLIRDRTNIQQYFTFATASELSTNSNAFMAMGEDFANGGYFFVPVFDGFNQWDLFAVGKGNSQYKGRFSMGGAGGVFYTNVQLNLGDIDTNINITLNIYSQSNGIYHASASAFEDGLTLDRLTAPGLNALTFHQGSGAEDWRVGMNTNGGYDLSFYSTHGGTSRASNPGQLMLQLKRSPDVTYSPNPLVSGSGLYGQSLAVTNDVAAGGTVSAQHFVGDGSGLTGISSTNTNPNSLTNNQSTAVTLGNDLKVGGTLNLTNGLSLYAPTGVSTGIQIRRPNLTTFAALTFSTETEHATNANAYVGMAEDFVNGGNFWVPIFDGFRQWDLLAVGKGNSSVPGRMALAGAGGVLKTNVQLNIGDIDTNINQTMAIYSQSNGILSSSASTYADGLTLERLTEPGLNALAFHQGSGAYDWRIGMHKSGGYNLDFYTENGTNSSSPSSPGELAFQLQFGTPPQVYTPFSFAAGTGFTGDGTQLSNAAPNFIAQSLLVPRYGYASTTTQNGASGWYGMQLQAAKSDTWLYLGRWSFSGMSAKQHTILVLNADGTTNGSVILPTTTLTNCFVWAPCRISITGGTTNYILTDSTASDGDKISAQFAPSGMDANITNFGAAYSLSSQGPYTIYPSQVFGPMNYVSAKGQSPNTPVPLSWLNGDGVASGKALIYNGTTWAPGDVPGAGTATNIIWTIESSTVGVNTNTLTVQPFIKPGSIDTNLLSVGAWAYLQTLGNSNALWTAASNMMWVSTNSLATGAFTPSNTIWTASSNLAYVAAFVSTNNLLSGAFTSSNTIWTASSNLAYVAAFASTNNLLSGAFTSSNTLWVAASNLAFRVTNALPTGAFNPATVVHAANANVTVTTNVAGGFTDYGISVGTGGTVTSVGLTAPTGFSVSGSPVTGSGTISLGLTTESANTFFSGPTSGGAATPGFRTITQADLAAVNVVSNGESIVTTLLAGLNMAGNLSMTNGKVSITNSTTGDAWLIETNKLWWTNPISHLSAGLVNGKFYGLGDALTNASGAGANGTVTSVSASVPPWMSVSGVPITGSGTIVLSNQAGVWETNCNAGKFFTNSVTGAFSAITTNGHLVMVDEFGTRCSLGTNWFSWMMTNGWGFGMTNGTFTVSSNFVVNGAMSLAELDVAQIISTNLSGGSITVTNYLSITNPATGDYIFGTNDSLTISNAVTAKQVVISNGVIYASSMSASKLAGTDANTNLISLSAGYGLAISGSTLIATNTAAPVADGWPLVTSNGVPTYTRNGGGLTNVSNATATNTTAGATINVADGASLTNLTYQFRTNTLNTGVLPLGQTVISNLTGNITVAGLSGVDMTVWKEGLAIFTNSTATDWSVTFPSGVIVHTNGATGMVIGQAIWCTNRGVTMVPYGAGYGMTNVAVIGK